MAYFLQRYLGNYVRGLNREALKISVWRGDVELTNMQLRPEALNALKLPVKVKAGFLGSVRLKVPWSRLGQEPVVVYLDRILVLAEPATQVEGCSEDAIQEAKKNRVQELEMRLLERHEQLKTEMNTSWLGSLISTIIGNIKLSITNIHIRYEDLESNPGHPFAAGMTLARLSAVTIDESGKETFATGGALERIQKSVELERLALYFDSDVRPWSVENPWEDLLPSEWNEIFEIGNKDGKANSILFKDHSYVLQPVTGNAKYTKLHLDESKNTRQALQQAAVNLDDVTICLSKEGYRDILKLADNFTAFNQRLKYAHYRPQLPVKSDPKSWWKYAYKALTNEMKKASGKLSWEQVLRHTRLRKRYVSLYASLLKSEANRSVVDGNKEIEKLDRELDIEVILQWRMLAHKFVEQSSDSDSSLNKQKAKGSWWSFGWSGSSNDGNESKGFTEEDWEQLNTIIGYKEGSNEFLTPSEDEVDLPHLFLEIHMKHNASKLIAERKECLADLSCEGLVCSLKTYSEAKVFNLKLGSYKLSSQYGLLAESATVVDSLVGVFSYKPFDAEVDWSLVAKASPCYMTYLKDSIDQVVDFFKSNTAISQTLALETAAAVQMTIDEVKRTAQQQVTRALKDQSRFFLDLDIAAPKITIPTKFCPDNSHATTLLLDLGNLMLSTQDYWDSESTEDKDMYLQFNFVLSDVSAFLVDGDYHWSTTPPGEVAGQQVYSSFLPVVDKCGIVLTLQQIQIENPLYPSTRLAVRLPSLGFHFSPARYHRLLQVAKIFQDGDGTSSDVLHPWSQADVEGWLFLLTRKGVGNREAVWQRRYVCLVGPFLYILENPSSKTYKQYVSLRGKQVHQVPEELAGDLPNLLALYDAGQPNSKVVEDVNALILRCDSDESRKMWQSRLQGAIYRTSGSAPISSLSDTSLPEDLKIKSFGGSSMSNVLNLEKLFVTGVLDELKISFNCSYQNNLSFKKMLVCKEGPLFEFRAVGGQVELSIMANNILVGTVLKSLEIEDKYCCAAASMPRYLARSFIKSTDVDTVDKSSHITDIGHQNLGNNRLSWSDSEEKFFEASDDLDDLADKSGRSHGSMSEYFSSQRSFSSTKCAIKPPSFSRIPGLVPNAEPQNISSDLEAADTLDSFVKAQIVIYDQDSSQYNSIDNRVLVTLATLSFFCQRPTILAILDFVNAINVSEDSDGYIDKSSAATMNISTDDSVVKPDSSLVEEPTTKGLFGKGKTRVIFYLTLNMTKAQIFLMNENGSSLATLSQNNLLTDIKVFPSSFSIKAALGNLKISDDSLPSSHPYFWLCDMRNPGGSSFVELDFSSFSIDDEDYNGYEYSLVGQLSEVRIVYLNRFVQEVVGYFMGLVPSNVESVVKLKDQITNSEMWVTTTEIEGSPAVKLDLSLSRPIIVMPRRTDSNDYLELDVLHITVQNTFQWLSGDKNEMSAVHLEILTIKVEDINLIVGSSSVFGESIIQDVKGLSVIIQRSLRDLLHQIPTTEVSIKVELLNAALTNREYEIITECALSNISETPHVVPSLDKVSTTSDRAEEHSLSLASTSIGSQTENKETWISMKVSVAIDLAELSLHAGTTRDSSLANVQATGAWILYKLNTCGEGFLCATLQGFSVIDAREGTKEQFRLAISRSETIENTSLYLDTDDDIQQSFEFGEREAQKELRPLAVPSMLIVDAIFRNSSTNVSLCIQRPKLLVALDFLLAVAEFFVPSVGNILSSGEEDDPLFAGSIVLDQEIYTQPTSVFSLSPRKPLVIDDERFDHFIYDGKGGQLVLQDREGRNISDFTAETIIYVGNGKRLQFKNVTILNGEYLDASIFLGTDSSYSASQDDNVFLEKEEDDALLGHEDNKLEGVVGAVGAVGADGLTEFVIELQAIGPDLTFYNTSEDVSESSALSTKVMHAHLDAFCRLVMKGDSFEINGSLLGLKMESNGIRVLEPFDTSVKFSNASGKTNIHLAVSEIFMNFSFSILRLFLSVEEDILAFLRTTSKKVSVVCSHFDKVATIQRKDQKYAFWRPCAPSGYAVLGDCLTPLTEPPSKGVLAVNASIARVKRPVTYKLIWSSSTISANNSNHDFTCIGSENDNAEQYISCSIWFPVAPKGYVAIGCVVSSDSKEPPLSSGLCILASLVSPCSMKDCVALNLSELGAANVAFWRVENSFGSFLPADPEGIGKAYDLRQMIFKDSDHATKVPKSTTIQGSAHNDDSTLQLERPAFLASGRMFESVASFRLIWWNQGAASGKRLSIWRPVLQDGMVYLGDIAVQGYEPPNSAIVLHDSGDEAFLKTPQDFQLVGRIRKHKGNESISFWLPQAPPGYVAMGCVTAKGTPKHEDFSSLRCVRSDMVTGDQFAEESIWDTADTKVSAEPLSLWSVGNEGTFIVRNGFKRPPKRFALKLEDPNVSSGSDNTVIDAEIKTFSAVVFDDYGGLMNPLFNIAISSIAFSLHGRPDYLKSTVSFSLAARSYNDKCDAWEPLVEPTDGFLRYQYDLNSPGAATQLRMTSTKDLNLNVSVSNANMMLQAYSSWNNLSHIDESLKGKEMARQASSMERAVIDVHHRKNYYIIPHNKLGQDIYIRATETKRFSHIIKMPSGDNKPVKVPVAKNMLDSHLNGKLGTISRSMVTIIIADAELPKRKELTTAQYTLAVRLFSIQPSDSPLQQQSARTSGAIAEYSPSEATRVNWSETLFFKIDSVENYMAEFVMVDVGRGEPVGIYSAPLKQIVYELQPSSNSDDSNFELTWRELSSAKEVDCQDDKKFHGRIRCVVLLSLRPEIRDEKADFASSGRSGFLQISPTKQGPWTTVRLNYAAPAACWRLGNNVVASEVTVRDGNRYVSIRSLVSVTNKTDFIIDLRLKSTCSSGNMKGLDIESKDVGLDGSRNHTEEFYEIEKYTPSAGWLSFSKFMPFSDHNGEWSGETDYQGMPCLTLPEGWEWTDDWHVDVESVRTADGWVYAPDTENLKWPESSDHINSVNYARQRRWIRNRKYVSYATDSQIAIGVLKPGHTVPLPLSGLVHPVISYVLQLRPKHTSNAEVHSWSSVVERHRQTQFSGRTQEAPEICVSALIESDELLYCSLQDGSSSSIASGLWFCLTIQATQIGKDVHSDPIHDWNLIIDSPLCITNFLPLSTEYAVSNKQSEDNSNSSQGVLTPGASIKIYNADLRDSLYLSVLPQGGWQPLHEPVSISHPSRMPSKMICLRNSFSGRIVQIMLEHNYDKERLISRVIRIYASYWVASARCPPLTYSLLDMSSRKERKRLSAPFHANLKPEKIICKITDEEMVGGYTIASSLNFKLLGITAAISSSECFGPVGDLSPLGDMDGSIDLYAYDSDGNCMRIFISSKPSPYPAVPTKVISVRPFMTFTNRLGQDVFVKFNVEDEPKILHASDSRVSFIYRKAGSDKLQVRLEDTNWCIPVEIIKEDTLIIVLRKHHGGRRFLRVEVRGYEEGSRFLVIFRLGSAYGPVRIENRTVTTIKLRQSGIDDDSWITLQPLSTTKFSWDDPYGQRLIDVGVNSGTEICLQNVRLENGTDSIAELRSLGFKLSVIESGDLKIVRFRDGRKNMLLGSHENLESARINSTRSSSSQHEIQNKVVPLELIVELGVVGVSLIDHRPRELLYLYLEKVFISYSTGYDAGTTSRFKLIVGKLQLDNQLPLTVMPVLLAPEDMPDINHPVFKATVTMSNDNADGTQVYPYVYIRVTDKCWKCNIHEPIIWALVDFYNNLRLDSIPSNSGITEVDPEIRIDLIDVSEVRLKLSLETAPTQRPQGVLGVWGPVLSAIGNAFKIQLHLRKVVHKSRYMRKSSIVPAIVNRIKRDLIHNPLHLIFSVDVLSMTKSTLASLSKGFAELSTDGQFLQLRTKQVWSRRVTGVGDGILQGTEAFAQGVAFGISGVLKKPVESAREHGVLGLAHGLGRAFLGFVVQPLSGALDFVSLTVDGIGASCSKCLEILSNKSVTRRIRNPRAFHSDGLLKEYCEREAVGQMILYLAEASRHLGCTDLFKEPSKYAWSDYYEDHFIVAYRRIVLVTNKRVMLLQCLNPDKMDKKPSKIIWDVPWEELLALELAKAGHRKPSHLIIHLRNFNRSESFVRLIKCNVVDDEHESQAVMICSSIRKMWKAHQSDMKVLTLKVPSSQRHVHFAWEEADWRDSYNRNKPMMRPRAFTTSISSDEMRFIKHTFNFRKIWSSERDSRSRCALFPKQVVDDSTIYSIWRPLCSDGYASVGDIAHVGIHPPHVAAIYRDSSGNFALPVGYDVVWRNCASDYVAPVSIWMPRPPDGFVAVGCVAVAAYEEPPLDSAYCLNARIVEEAQFEEQIVWTAPDSFPWACYIYQVQSEALQFVALRQPKEESDWRPMRVSSNLPPQVSEVSRAES